MSFLQYVSICVIGSAYVHLLKQYAFMPIKLLYCIVLYWCKHTSKAKVFFGVAYHVISYPESANGKLYIGSATLLLQILTGRYALFNDDLLETGRLPQNRFVVLLWGLI